MRDQDDFTKALVREGGGFYCARRLADGTYVGIAPLAFTKALCIGITPEVMYTRRYCFADLTTALAEYRMLQSGQDIPSGWVARRPETAEDIEAKRKPNYDASEFWPRRTAEYE